MGTQILIGTRGTYGNSSNLDLRVFGKNTFRVTQDTCHDSVLLPVMFDGRTEECSIAMKHVVFDQPIDETNTK